MHPSITTIHSLIHVVFFLHYPTIELTVQKCSDHSVKSSAYYYAGSFHRVSVTHRTVAWTTGSLTCVRDRSHACRVHTGGGWATPTWCFFTRKKTLTNFSCALDGGSNLGTMESIASRGRPLYQLSHPVTPVYSFTQP